MPLPGTIPMFITAHRAGAQGDQAGGGGGGGGYRPKAVRFPAGSYIVGGQAESGTTQVASGSMFVRAANVDNFAFFLHQANNGIDVSTGFNFVAFDINMDALGGGINQGTDDNTVDLDQYMHIAWNMDLSPAQHSRIMNLFKNGVSVLDHDLDADSRAGTASIDKTNEFVLPGYTATTLTAVFPQGEGVPFDVWGPYIIWLGTYIDWSDPSNMAKVRDAGTGFPVDPALAVAAFGQPQVLQDGDKDGFVVTQGTGASFELRTYYTSLGSNGPSALSIPGAVVGKSVIAITDAAFEGDYSSEFEASISVGNQIQQTGSSDLSGTSLIFHVEGTLLDTDAPSD